MSKIKLPGLIVVFSLILTACSSGLAATGPSLQSKLGAGLLALEGTTQAVTAEQASILIPFWQAYKSLSVSGSSSQSEIQALYRQMQETLTSEQLASIQKNEFSQETLSTLMRQYNVKANPTSRTQTQSASTSTQNSSAQPNMGDMGGGLPPGGEMGSGGGVEAELGGASAAVSGSSSETAPETLSSPTAAASGLNTLFADAVLQVLAQRVQA